MHKVIVIGAGKIGSLITFLLAQSNHYFVYLADQQPQNPFQKKFSTLKNYQYHQLDANDTQAITNFLEKHSDIKTIISSLPYYCNIPIAKIAARSQLHYFDLTEDVSTTCAVQQLAHNASSAFIPQCGLAPGFISIVANDLMRKFSKLDTVKMRVGALPENTSNALQYSLTWSTDGLINEYGNSCQAIDHGMQVDLLPLEGLEAIKLDGLTYEAFNTSGGIGSLADTYQDKLKHLNYKTIRYPGHCEKIKFLMNDLRLNDDRETLKHILENTLPKTYQDVVLVYVSVTGYQDNIFVEENYFKKYYPKIIDGERWSAIQLTTASGICAAVDIVMKSPESYKGFIRQEEFSFEKFLNNHFGNYYA